MPWVNRNDSIVRFYRFASKCPVESRDRPLPHNLELNLYLEFCWLDYFRFLFIFSLVSYLNCKLYSCIHPNSVVLNYINLWIKVETLSIGNNEKWKEIRTKLQKFSMQTMCFSTAIETVFINYLKRTGISNYAYVECTFTILFGKIHIKYVIL